MTTAAAPTYSYDHPALSVHGAYTEPDRAGGLLSLDRAHLRADCAVRCLVDPSVVAAEGGMNVIVDTNAVFNRPGVVAALRTGETPVVTGTTRAELANLVASGKVRMPRYSGELKTIPDVMDVNLRINIRGAMRPGQRGLFGDGAIGATAVRTRSPVITADRNFASVLESLGVEVRIP